MHRSVTPMAMRNVNVGWVWSKVGFTMDMSMGSILETTQLDGPSWHLDCISACWMHQMAPSNRWMYRNWTLFVEIVNRIVGGGGHKWTGMSVNKLIWKIKMWRSFFGRCRPPEQLPWFAMESWCDCRVPIYLQRFLFRLRGLREWGGLCTRRLSLKNSFIRRCGYSTKKNTQPSLVLYLLCLMVIHVWTKNEIN